MGRGRKVRERACVLKKLKQVRNMQSGEGDTELTERTWQGVTEKVESPVEAGDNEFIVI